MSESIYRKVVERTAAVFVAGALSVGAVSSGSAHAEAGKPAGEPTAKYLRNKFYAYAQALDDNVAPQEVSLDAHGNDDQMEVKPHFGELRKKDIEFHYGADGTRQMVVLLPVSVTFSEGTPSRPGMSAGEILDRAGRAFDASTEDYVHDTLGAPTTDVLVVAELEA